MSSRQSRAVTVCQPACSEHRVPAGPADRQPLAVQLGLVGDASQAVEGRLGALSPRGGWAIVRAGECRPPAVGEPVLLMVRAEGRERLLEIGAQVRGLRALRGGETEIVLRLCGADDPRAYHRQFSGLKEFAPAYLPREVTDQPLDSVHNG